MSDQSDTGAPPSGTGATGADAFAAADGVDQHALGVPETNGQPQNGGGFDRIHARMDELTAQQQAIVQALELPDFDYLDGDAYEDSDYGDELSDEEIAAELGIDPEDIIAVDRAREQDVLDLIDRSIDNRLEGIEAEHAVEDRDADFNDLRDAMPILQDERTARAIVNRAQELAMAWDPRVIETPAMVDLIELVAKAAVADRAIASERPAPPPQIQLESAQGASQPTAHPSAEDYWGNRIVAAAQRLRPQI